VSEQHFARTFGKIDFVPVKQMNVAEEWNEKQRADHNQQRLCGKLTSAFQGDSFI
jgi:hypothetical protein